MHVVWKPSAIILKYCRTFYWFYKTRPSISSSIPWPNAICNLLKREVFGNRYFGNLRTCILLVYLNCGLTLVIYVIREPTFTSRQTSLLGRRQIKLSSSFCVYFINRTKWSYLWHRVLGTSNLSSKWCFHLMMSIDDRN